MSSRILTARRAMVKAYARHSAALRRNAPVEVLPPEATLAFQRAIPKTLAHREMDGQHLRAVVLSDALPERNGVGSYYADLIHQLESRMEAITIECTTPPRNSFTARLSLPLPGDASQRIGWPRPVRVRRLIEKMQPHALILPTPGPFGLYGMALAREFRIPIITGFHTHLEALAEIYWTGASGFINKTYLNNTTRLLFQQADHVLVNSEEILAVARRLGGRRKLRVMGTPLSPAFADTPPIATAGELRRVLFAGRLAGEKNVPDIIELARQRPALEVSIAGDGPMQAEVRAAAAALPNLTYLGWVGRETLVDVVDQHDLLLLPSRVESFGTVALEGLSRGRSVIVSDACGIAQWPALRRSLYLIGETQSVASVVDQVLAESPLERLRRNGEAREAAIALNEWNLTGWLQLIDDCRKRQLIRNGHSVASTSA